jgi:hypothetical protein
MYWAHRRAQRDKGVGADPGFVPLDLAVEAEQQSDHGSEAKPQEQVPERTDVQRVSVQHGSFVTPIAGPVQLCERSGAAPDRLLQRLH